MIAGIFICKFVIPVQISLGKQVIIDRCFKNKTRILTATYLLILDNFFTHPLKFKLTSPRAVLECGRDCSLSKRTSLWLCMHCGLKVS